MRFYGYVGGLGGSKGRRDVMEWTGLELAQGAPRPCSQSKADLFTPEGQRAGNKRQRKTFDRGQERREGEVRVKGEFILRGQRTASAQRGDRCGP